MTQPQAILGPSVRVLYSNHRGEVSVRTIFPYGVWFGTTDHHSEPQYFLACFDHDRQANRDYACRDIHIWGLGATDPGFGLGASFIPIHEGSLRRLLEEREQLRRQNTSLQAKNTELLERARAAEAKLAELVDGPGASVGEVP